MLVNKQTPFSHGQTTMTTESNLLTNSWMVRNSRFTFPSSHHREDERLENLRRRWDESVNHFFTITTASKRREHLSHEWFDKIIDMHLSDEGRAYHTVCHLEEMFGYLDMLLLPIVTHNDHATISSEDRAVLTLSTFFHDAVYDPTSNTNEEDSVSLFRQFYEQIYLFDDDGTNKSIRGTVSKEKEDAQELVWAQRVMQYILATKHHHHDTATSGIVVDQDSNDLYCLQLFLDMDMAVLGKQWHAYDVYASLIRIEYSHVPHDLYCDTRANILESFYLSSGGNHQKKKKTVFATNIMRDALEENAIYNLRREVSMLRQGIIPCDQQQQQQQK